LGNFVNNGGLVYINIWYSLIGINIWVACFMVRILSLSITHCPYNNCFLSYNSMR